MSLVLASNEECAKQRMGMRKGKKVAKIRKKIRNVTLLPAHTHCTNEWNN